MVPLQNLFCQLGICLYNESGHYRSFEEVINGLTEIWDKLDEGQTKLFADIIKENNNEK